MKKLLTLIAATMLASSASAISFTWQSGNTAALRVQFGADNYVAATAYLVNLNSGWSVSGYSVENTVVSTADAGTTGRYSKAYQASIANGEVHPGDTFGVFLTYTITDANTGTSQTWFNIMNYTYTIPSTADDTTTIAAQSFGTNANYAIAGEDKPLTSGGGWVAASVPEPSTAMLALAGLALLIKRRRA